MMIDTSGQAKKASVTSAAPQRAEKKNQANSPERKSEKPVKSLTPRVIDTGDK